MRSRPRQAAEPEDTSMITSEAVTVVGPDAFTRFGDVIIRGTSLKRRRLCEVDGKDKAREMGAESVRHADRAVHGAGRS